MRLLCLFGLMACAKADPTPAPAPVDPPPPTVAPIPTDAAPAVEPADAMADTTVTYASLRELFGLDDRGPRASLAGYQLGHPADAPFRHIVITGWGEGSASPILRDNLVVHVVVELAPAVDPPDFAAMSRELQEVTKQLAHAFGAPKRGGRASWRNADAQLFAIEYDGFLRGTPSLVLDLLPPGEEHVCGSRDGFAAFFASFRGALVAKNEAALEKMIVVNPDDDRLAERPALSRLPPKPACHLSREVYYWRTIEKMHGGAYWQFSSTGRIWKAEGPFHIGHDDDPNVSAP